MRHQRFDPPRSAVIAVLTFQRNAALAELLPHLVNQTRSVSLATDVLVVDNDPEQQARQVVEPFEHLGVRYVHEPKPGIAHARNRALEAADRDLLVFIDDDEVPTAHWLQWMLKTFDENTCVGVVGNVTRTFDVEPDSWVIAGGFFAKPPIPSGTPQPAASTANLLLDLRFLREHDLRFDTDFGLSGGSDNLLTKQIVAAGGQLLWCSEALVVERIPANRVTRQWVMRRHFRVGNGDCRTSLAMADSGSQRASVRIDFAANGLGRVVVGSARRLWGKLRRNEFDDARGARTVARGAGMLSGALGYHYDREYRQLRAAPASPEISAAQQDEPSPAVQTDPPAITAQTDEPVREVEAHVR